MGLCCFVSAGPSLLPELHSDDMGVGRQQAKDAGRKHSGGGRSRLVQCQQSHPQLIVQYERSCVAVILCKPGLCPSLGQMGHIPNECCASFQPCSFPSWE